MVNIKDRIADQVSKLLGPLEPEAASSIAESLIREAEHIGGLSIVKATGPSEYVRDYIAYAMVRKLLGRNSDAFCDEVISLDAFQHWFDDSLDGRQRPDILRLEAQIVDGYFHIRAQIIECKLAQQSEGYLEVACQQIESGIRQLAACFRPRQPEIQPGIHDRPDQRYWWLQLHRLVASTGRTSYEQREEALTALERLSEGYFTITWQAAAVAFWTDVESDTLNCTPQWDFSLEGQSLLISAATAGRRFVGSACLDGQSAGIFCDGPVLTYSFAAEQPPVAPGGPPGPGQSNGKDEPQDQGQLKGPANEPGDIKIGPSPTSAPISPERILIGTTTGAEKNVYWEFGHPQLPNRHILLFGASGTGKTYTIQALLHELAKMGQNSLIVDYTNGFTTSQLEQVFSEKLKPKQHIVKKEPLPINPFRRQSNTIDDIEIEDTPTDVAQRVAGVFSEVYNLGDQQKAILYGAIKDGIEREKEQFNLRRLLSRLQAIYQTGGPTGTSAATVTSKILPFVDTNPFAQEDPESWERLFTDPSSRCHILQLASFMKDAARLITEFSLIDLYWYYRAKGNKDKPRVIVLDEIQNLDHRLDSPLGQFLTEGRKFGISLILATQTLSNLGKDERDRLFQASHKLFFKPADTEIKSFAQILADATHESTERWVSQLSQLKRGECFSLGHAYNETTKKLSVGRWFKIRVTPLEQR